MAKLFGVKNSMYWQKIVCIGMTYRDIFGQSASFIKKHIFSDKKTFFSITFFFRSCFCFCFLHPSSLHVVKSDVIKHWWSFWVRTFSFLQHGHVEKFVGLSCNFHRSGMVILSGLFWGYSLRVLVVQTLIWLNCGAVHVSVM